jgi:hypothetical protein
MAPDESASTTRRRVLSYGAALGVLGAASLPASGQDDASSQQETPATETESPATETESPATETPSEAEPATFRVRIENVSESDTLTPSDGSEQAVPISPGAYAVHTTIGPLFVPGVAPLGNGLESIAEDGDPSTMVETLADQEGIAQSGAFDTPADAESPGPAGPGDAYEFTVEASPGERLSFATMFIPSNDLFFAPGEAGIPLFDETGTPIDGSVTDQVLLWDAGTEVNEEPGVGPNQAQRQSAPDTGPDEGGPVSPISAVDDGYEYPDVSEVVEVTVTLEEEAETETPAIETETPAIETETPAAETETAVETPTTETPATETETPATETQPRTQTLEPEETIATGADTETPEVDPLSGGTETETS